MAEKGNEMQEFRPRLEIGMIPSHSIEGHKTFPLK